MTKPRASAAPPPKKAPAKKAVAKKTTATQPAAATRAPAKPTIAARPKKVTKDRAPSDEPPLVLIVDDFVDTREMYLEYLQFAGFRAIDASDGREAIDKAIALHPSLILMDLAMPTMDGWEATRRLKSDARTKKIPVIAVTGHALRGDAERARQAGCDGVISKPCLPEQLVEEVRRVLSRG